MEVRPRVLIILLALLIPGDGFAQRSAPTPSVVGRGTNGGDLQIFELPGNNRIQYSPPPAYAPVIPPSSRLEPKIIRTEQSQKLYDEYLARRKKLLARSAHFKSLQPSRLSVSHGAGNEFLARRNSRLIGNRITPDGIEKPTLTPSQGYGKPSISVPTPPPTPPSPPTEQELERDKIRQERAEIREKMLRVQKFLHNQAREQKLAESHLGSSHQPAGMVTPNHSASP